jgi:hypothetical protein
MPSAHAAASGDEAAKAMPITRTARAPWEWRYRAMPGSIDPSGGTNGSHQGLLIRGALGRLLNELHVLLSAGFARKLPREATPLLSGPRAATLSLVDDRRDAASWHAGRRADAPADGGTEWRPSRPLLIEPVAIPGGRGARLANPGTGFLHSGVDEFDIACLPRRRFVGSTPQANQGDKSKSEEEG